MRMLRLIGMTLLTVMLAVNFMACSDDDKDEESLSLELGYLKIQLVMGDTPTLLFSILMVVEHGLNLKNGFLLVVQSKLIQILTASIIQ